MGKRRKRDAAAGGFDSEYGQSRADVGNSGTEVFGQIADARSRLLNATQAAPQGADGDKTPEQKQAVIEANNSFGGTIGRLLSLQENYPQLRSNELFMTVQNELSGTENRINVARLDYNDAVTNYNTDA
jgi:LemA protein